MARPRKMQGFLKRSGVWHVRTDPVTGKQRSTGSTPLWRTENPSCTITHTETRQRLAPDVARARLELLGAAVAIGVAA